MECNFDVNPITQLDTNSTLQWRVYDVGTNHTRKEAWMRITIEWVKAHYPSEKFVLVDCRKSMNGTVVTSKGAKFMPLSDFANASQDLDTDTPVIVYCRSGIRSLKATVFYNERASVQHP